MHSGMFEDDPGVEKPFGQLVGASQRAYATTLRGVAGRFTVNRPWAVAAVKAAFTDHSERGALVAFPDTPRDAIAACPFPYTREGAAAWEAFVASYEKAARLLRLNFRKEVAKL